jgi:hypothetical protein
MLNAKPVYSTWLFIGDDGIFDAAPHPPGNRGQETIHLVSLALGDQFHTPVGQVAHVP